MRLQFCEACGADGYQAVMESDDGQIELLHAHTIPRLREIVLSRVGPSRDHILRVDELFDELLDRDVLFLKQWLKIMDSRMNRVAA